MSEKKYLFGVDVGGTSIKIGLFNINGELLEKWEIPTDTANAGENILKDISKSLNKKIQDNNLSKDEFEGIGVGVPGPVDTKGVVHSCVNVGWGTLPVANILEGFTGLRVKATNDANAAALGEMWKGQGQGTKSLIMITIGTGIGGGIIIDEKVVSGTNGSGGEIGHMTINPEEREECNCGKKGCVEQYASATGMVNEAKKLIKEGFLKTDLVEGKLSAKKIVDAAKNNDELALAVVEKMGRVLGLALSSAACLCDPEIIIIGGGVSKAGVIVCETIEKYYRSFAFHATNKTPITIATLGNDAGIYGAARLLL